MNLYIRSQNREVLIKYHCLGLEEQSGNKWSILNYDGLEFYQYLGIYDYERALEVLDEIQKLLMPTIISTPIIEKDIKPEYTYIHYVSKGYDTEVTQLNSYVYEMPKE